MEYREYTETLIQVRHYQTFLLARSRAPFMGAEEIVGLLSWIRLTPISATSLAAQIRSRWISESISKQGKAPEDWQGIAYL